MSHTDKTEWVVRHPAGTDTYSSESQAESRAEYLRDRYGHEVTVEETND